jgi:hypothetical protein
MALEEEIMTAENAEEKKEEEVKNFDNLTDEQIESVKELSQSA